MTVPTAKTLPTALLSRFAEIVGARYAVVAPGDLAAYGTEPRGLFTKQPAMALRPGSPEEISRILKLANETATPIIPQGGNTGLVGGQVPTADGREIILSLGRLNQIRSVDRESATMIAEAGVILADAQRAADEAGLLLPISLASEGSCQIGGILSTNAGGTGVLVYGNARATALGLEVVLPTGEIWRGLRTLRKDNTGYDLKDIFIGAEGTLGVITAASLSLAAKPKGRSTAFAAVASPEDALKLFNLARSHAGLALVAFELIPRIGIDFELKHLSGVRDPLSKPYPWYVLAEIASQESETAARAMLETIFADGFEKGLVIDAALSQSIEQARAFWHIRENLSDIQKAEGASIKHDIAVPVFATPEFLARATAAVETISPGCRPVPFGHLGDGNIHFNVNQPVGADPKAFLALWEVMNEAVHGITRELGGSISAEHGIGTLKRGLLPGVKEPVEIEMMRRLKATFDPNGILNPGKIL